MAGLTDIELLLPEMRAYAISISRCADEADELVQDAAERALKSDSRPQELDSLRPWLFRVIRNLHFDELRKRRIRRKYFSLHKRLLGAHNESQDQERDVLLRLAFEKLAPEGREILFLIDVMGLKYEEAGEIIGVPTGTVMSRISRARRSLLKLVDGDGCSAAAMKWNGDRG